MEAGFSNQLKEMRKKSEFEINLDHLKSNPTLNEKIISGLIKEKGYHFSFKQTVGFFVVDFLIPEKMLIIRISDKKHDSKCDKFCKSIGFKVLRISPNQILTILEKIDDFEDLVDFEEQNQLAISKADKIKMSYVGKSRPDIGLAFKNKYRLTKRNSYRT